MSGLGFTRAWLGTWENMGEPKRQSKLSACAQGNLSKFCLLGLVN